MDFTFLYIFRSLRRRMERAATAHVSRSRSLTAGAGARREAAAKHRRGGDLAEAGAPRRRKRRRHAATPPPVSLGTEDLSASASLTTHRIHSQIPFRKGTQTQPAPARLHHREAPSEPGPGGRRYPVAPIGTYCLPPWIPPTHARGHPSGIPDPIPFPISFPSTCLCSCVWTMHGEREGLLLLDRSADAMERGGERHHPLSVFLRDARLAFRWDDLGQEIMRIAVPGALALMADPVASLVDTAFIGHIGPVELGAVGVSIAVFNQVSRIAVFPLVSVTTSFVAEEDALSNGRDNDKINQDNECNVSVSEMEELISPEGASATTSISSFETDSCEVSVEQKRKNIPSVSTALLLGGVLGLLETLLLVLSAKPILGYMGVTPDSAMMKPALQYLVLRSLGAPAVLLSLATQGVFRGFKDTKTPLYATVAGDAINIVLDPIFIFVFQYGVSGAAIAHVISQYLIASILLWRLRLHVDLLPPSFKHLQFGRFLKNGFLLLARVIAATFCVTLSASMAARLGSTPMAAFQICLQTWLACSLLADGLAFAGQAILASAFARKDYPKATATASRILQLALVLGLILSILLGIGLRIGSKLFTDDQGVLHHIYIGIPFVCLTQPINALAFVFDGINYGASDFGYAAYSMVLVAIVSIICILTLESYSGFIGIWIALVIYMSLRMFAGFWRIGTAQGPWAYLRS